MSAPSVDIKDMIEAESSLGLTFATDLFIGREPLSPDDCVTIFDTPGFPPDLTLNKTEIYNRPSIQIRVRDRSYTTGWNLINNLKVFLHGLAHETWNSSYYSLIECSIEPAHLEWDKHDRAVFVTTFDIQRR